MQMHPVAVATDITTGPRSAGGARPALRRARAALRRTLLHLSPVTWAHLDLALVALGTIGAYRLIVSGNPAYDWVDGPWLTCAVYCVGLALAGMIFGLFERATVLARSRILVRTLAASGLGLGLGHACLALLFGAEASRWLGACVLGFYLATALPLRVAAHELVTRTRSRVLCVGSTPSIRKLVALLRRDCQGHHQVVGYVTGRCAADGPQVDPQPVREAPPAPDDARSQRAFERACPRLGSVDAVARIARELEIDEVVVAAELAADDAVGNAVMACMSQHCRVTDQPTFVEKLLGEVPVSDLTPHWFMAADVYGGGAYAALKRLADLVAAGLGLMLTLPLWPLIALLIRLESAGPAIYRQRRVGLHGREFEICKFRTMRADAEADGARWASSGDRRVTRVGRVLRRTRIDELPQLWNILRGEMSLVGPRPERPEFVADLCRRIPHYAQRHLIKPGLTGWAQIHCGYGSSVEDAQRKLCYDLYYLKHRSFELDVAVLIRTVGTFLRGAR